MTKTKLKEPYELFEDEARDLCLNHWESEIDDSDTLQKYYDLWVYEETSADGYSIWIATCEEGKVYPSESVYYYADGLDEVVLECLRTGGTLRISASDYEELESHGIFDWQELYAGIYEELANNDDDEN